MSSAGVKVPLYTSGRRSGLTLVSAVDHDRVTYFVWHLTKNGYAYRYEGRTCILLHRWLVGLKDPAFVVDHKNRDKLDNRRRNLRVCTRQTNVQNMAAKGGSSRFRGVTFFKRDGRWRAQATISGTHHHIGYFDREEDAAAAAASYRLEHMEGALD